MSPRSSKKKSKKKPAKKKGGGPSPAPDVYVGLLFVSLSALTTGIIFLVLELGNYGWQMGP